MKKNTIRKKIIINSVLIIMLTALIILISFNEFNSISIYSEQILQLAVQMTELMHFKEHFEDFEVKLKELIAFDSEIQKDYINNILKNIFLSIENLQRYNYYPASTHKIYNSYLFLKDLFNKLPQEKDTGESSKENNELISNILSTTSSINILADSLLRENINQIKNYETAQKENIYYAIFKLSLICFVNISIYILLGFILSKNISMPILKLINATNEIHKGNYNIKAYTDNSDEIGELAVHFNTMTQKLKTIIYDLRESEEKYKALFENANDAIVIHDNNHNFIQCNNKALEILKISRENLLGNSLYNISPKYQPDGQKSKEKYTELLSLAIDNKPQYFEWEFECGDNLKMYTEISLTSFVFKDKKYLQSIIRDITTGKNAEIQIRQLSSELLKAHEAESQKISRILHNSVIQTLTASKLYFDLYKMEQVKQNENLDLGITFLNKAGDEIKNIYMSLYPEILTDFGLKKTIEWHLKNYLESRNIKTDFNFNVKKKLKHDFEVNLYRIFQDIFLNIIEYFTTRFIKIDIQQEGSNKLLINVFNNAYEVNNDKSEEYKKEFRIKDIKQRVFEYNGIIDISIIPDGGTKYYMEFKI